MPQLPAFTRSLFTGEVSAWTDIGAPPPGFRWVVRDIEVVPGTAASTEIFIGQSPRNWFYHTFVSVEPNPLHAQWEGRVAIDNPATLIIYPNALVVVTITGYELSLS